MIVSVLRIVRTDDVLYMTTLYSINPRVLQMVPIETIRTPRVGVGAACVYRKDLYSPAAV